MKTASAIRQTSCRLSFLAFRLFLLVPLVAALASIFVAPTAHAASQTWTNAPSTVLWGTPGNWIGNAAPGVTNWTGNATSGDTATFNSVIPGGTLIGGSANPIAIDPPSASGANTRLIRGVTFDTSAGAYVFVTSNNAFGSSTLFVSAVDDATVGYPAIYLSSAVANPQVFHVPMAVRLPSSHRDTDASETRSQRAQSAADMSFSWRYSASVMPER